MFRDLSEDVKLKCMRIKSKKDQQSKALSKVPENDTNNVVDERLIKEPYAFSNDCAALFFFHDYVLTETRQPSNLFDLLPGIYQTSRPDSPLANIITALGLVCLANTKGIPEVMIPARARYVAALHNINISIRDPSCASADETLMVVILLGLYEDNTAIPGSLEQWSKHVHGAIALLDIRGSKQLKRRVGRQLITNLRTSTIANCLLKHTSVPQCIMQWSALLKEYESPEEASATALADIVASFCQLQECMKTAGNTVNGRNVVPMALLIDAELEKWAAIERYERPYTSIKAEPTSDLTFEGSYTTYHNLSVATHWNHYRSIRIMVNEIILGQLEQDSPQLIDSYFETTTPNANQIELSKILIISLSQEICASVRYCLCFAAEVNNSHQPEKAAYAKLLLWPLYTAGKSACVPDATSSWIADAFDFITRVMGVRKGASLAKALRAWPCAVNSTARRKAHWRDAVLRTDHVKHPSGMYLIC